MNFYKKLYRQASISSHYKEAIDDIDLPFFEAFYQDFSLVVSAYNQKRSLNDE